MLEYGLNRLQIGGVAAMSMLSDSGFVKIYSKPYGKIVVAVM
jgi:hypothetical protein